MKTNINRLHDVVAGQKSGRGAGKTYASCHELAGIIETNKDIKNIFWKAPYGYWFDHIKPMLHDVLIEHELNIEVIDKHNWKCNGVTIKFIFGNEHYIEQKTRAYKYYEIDSRYEMSYHEYLNYIGAREEGCLQNKKEENRQKIDVSFCYLMEETPK